MSFEPDAKKIFESAGVDPKANPELLADVERILSTTMARLSVTHGMSWTRIERYTEQQEALVEDLIELKAAGKLK